MNNVGLSGLLIDNRCFGETMLLNRIVPYYAYVNDQKTDKIMGYKYSVVLPGKGFQTLDVKAESDKPLVQIPVDADYVAVAFADLKVKLYYDNDHRIRMSAKAADIRLAT